MIKPTIVIPDLHYPYHNKAYLKVLFKLINDLKPNRIVYGGDCFDAYGISRFAKRDGLDIEEGVWQTHQEMLGFKKDIYDPIKKLCGKDTEIMWAGGNHDEQRTREAIEQLPERKELIHIPTMFPDAKLCEYNKFLKIGKLWITHGIYTNDAHAKKHVLNCEKNVMYFHTHTDQEYTKVTMGDNQVHAGVSMGCACDKNPDYMKNRPNSWVHIIGVLYTFKNGDFNLYKIKVINGKFIYNGKIYG